jgi:dTDP-4-dehydrorhamnose reductase
VVFLSTDYVFDGKGGPYSEEDSTSPESVYGKTKLEAEQIVLTSPTAIVGRTSVVYDWDPDSLNFVMQMIKRFSEKQPTRVVSDQLSHPTLARNLADMLLDLVNARASGIFNTVGPDYFSRFDFTSVLVRTFGFDPSLLSATTTAELNQKAPRPKFCNLRLDKLKRTISTPLIGVEQGLELVRRDHAAVAGA